MPLFQSLLLKSRETLEIYWLLVKITVPISVLTEVLSRLGLVEAIAPAFGQPCTRLASLQNWVLRG